MSEEEQKQNIVKRRWGYYEVLDEDATISEKFKIKMLHLFPNKSISKQYHNHREEYWIVLQGMCELSLESESTIKKRGDMIHVPKRTIHKLTNTGQNELILLELQIGEKTEEEDIVRLEEINGEV
jgi:mannose-6-phosphate isomerase-like protein (cupin superfamily)